MTEYPRPYKLDDAGHSIERFIERHYGDDARPSVTDAKTILEIIRSTAVFVEDVPDERQQIWRGAGMFSRVKLVVRAGVVCTVLPLGAERPPWRRRATRFR